MAAAAAYPFLAVVEYNTRPVVPGRGSGIFLHAQTGGPTIGCISLRKEQLRDRAPLAATGRGARDRDRNDRTAPRLKLRAAAGTLLFLVRRAGHRRRADPVVAHGLGRAGAVPLGSPLRVVESS